MTRQTPQWLQNGSYPAARDRMLLGALWPTAAVTGMAVTVATGMNLNVAPGQAAVPTPNNTGTTLCTSDATETVTISAAPASGYSRIDVVTVHPRGNDLDGGPNDDWIVDVIVGAVAQSPTNPTPPAVPAGQLAIAQVTVPGGAASIVAGNISDVRPSGLAMRPPLALCRLRQSALQGIPGGFAITQLTTLITETNIGGGVWAANAYTVPRSGYYRVVLNVSYSLNTVMNSGNPTQAAHVYVNGALTTPVNTSTSQVSGQIATGTSQALPLSRVLPLVAGNTVDFRTAQNWTSTLNTNQSATWADIEELGIPLTAT